MPATSLLDLFSDVRTVGGGIGAGLRIVPLEGDREIVRGTYELPVQGALADLVREGAVVHDIGANIGFFTLLAARLSGPAGRVHAFEPVPRNAAAISRSARLSGLGQVVVHQVAVGAAGGQGCLNLARHIGGAMLSSVGAPPDQRGTVTVEVVAIDDLVASGEVPPPDVVKIDVEGAELDVIRGMTRTLHERRPVLICELDDARPEGLKRKAEVLAGVLTGLGYALERLPDSYPDAGWEVAHFVARCGG